LALALRVRGADATRPAASTVRQSTARNAVWFALAFPLRAGNAVVRRARRF